MLHSSPIVDLCEWRPRELVCSAAEVISQLTGDTDITEELRYVWLSTVLSTYVHGVTKPKCLFSFTVLLCMLLYVT